MPLYTAACSENHNITKLVGKYEQAVVYLRVFLADVYKGIDRGCAFYWQSQRKTTGSYRS